MLCLLARLRKRNKKVVLLAHLAVGALTERDKRKQWFMLAYGNELYLQTCCVGHSNIYVGRLKKTPLKDIL